MGWGGYFEQGVTPDGETRCYTNHGEAVKPHSQKYEEYFYPAVFNNFAARMDWAERGTGNRNPVVVVNGQDGLDALHLDCRAGERVTLDASASYDLDGDGLSFRWWTVPEAGTYAGAGRMVSGQGGKHTVVIPQDAAGKLIHWVCEVTDDGAPSLTSYRRIIIDVHQ